MRTKTRLRWFLVATVVALASVFLLASCGDEDETGGGAATDTPAALTAEPTHAADGTPTGAAVREITVVSSDSFTFDPAELELVAGERVRITLDNTGAAILHDLTIEGLEADSIVSEGTEVHTEGGEEPPELHVAAEARGTATLEFTPTSTGEFVFYCTVEGHRDAGMEGTLTVTE